MEKTIQIGPSYGRDYSSAQRAIVDFEADKDFTIQDIDCKDNGRQCNKTDLINQGYILVRIRYNRNERVTTHGITS